MLAKTTLKPAMNVTSHHSLHWAETHHLPLGQRLQADAPEPKTDP